MIKDIKDVTFVVDASGSMLSCKEQVIDGFNQFLADLQGQQNMEIRLTLTLFNTQVRLEHEGAHVAEVPPLTAESYRPDGLTSLYDALGHSVRALQRRWAGSTDPTILVVVMTDGQENSSREFSKAAIRALIEECDKQPNWTFVYLGATEDAWAEASPIGFTFNNTRSYEPAATGQSIHQVSVNTQTLMSSGAKKTADFFGPPSASPARPSPNAVSPPHKPAGNPFAKPDPTRPKQGAGGPRACTKR